jgi:glyoxylase-like metal-dependent hydrolase (beta-lactamase superfamily II)
MSEPKAVATRVESVLEGVFQWTVSDDRIGGAPSNATALEESPGRVVLIDPIRLESKELGRLGEVVAILLTMSSHQRAAAHYRDLTGAAIWAPAGAKLEFPSDATFGDRDRLPGGLTAIAVPGASGSEFESECAFYLNRSDGVLIVGDALLNMEDHGGFCVFPKEFNPDPEKTRRSCRRLLDLDFEVLLFGHGQPIRSGARRTLEELLGHDVS